MTAPLVLLGYAILVATAGSRCLQRAEWPQRSPRLGILLWQALAASVVVSVVLAGAALALPALPVTTSVAEFLEACAMALREHYATPGGAALSFVGAFVVIAVVGRVTYFLAVVLSKGRRERAVQRRSLALVAGRDLGSGALVVEYATPAVYCLPGRGREVVFTSAALAALDAGQVDAVLAHEWAHLRGRHDLVLAAAGALQAAFPFISFFAVARAELARLVEMHADDTAVGDRDRLLLATALVTLAEGTAPPGTLGAGGASAVARVRRLAQPALPLGRPGSLFAAIGTGAVLVVPILIAAAPAVAAAAMDYCPVGFPS